MRIGQTKAIQIEDLTFNILRDRGPRRRWIEAMGNMPAIPESDAETDAFNAAMLAREQAATSAYMDLIEAVVISVENLFDEAGNVVKWPVHDKAGIIALLDQLPSEVTGELYTAVNASGTKTEAEDSEQKNVSGGSGGSPSVTLAETP